MKKNILKNYIYASMLFSALFFVSCNQDAEGVKGELNGNISYSFASSTQSVELSAADNGVIKVPVYRGDATSDGSVVISTTFADKTTESLFKLDNTTISFKKGENIAYALLNFGSVENLGATAKYEIILNIPQENLSPSGKSKITVDAARKLTWKLIGKGTYSSWLFESAWEQPIEKADEGNIYRLPNCFKEGYPIIFALSADGTKCVSFSDQETGEVTKYGMLSVRYITATGMVREGNKLSFPINYFVPAGSYGKGIDVVTLPQ